MDEDKKFECLANQLVDRILVDLQLDKAKKDGIISGYSEPVEVRPGHWEVDVVCIKKKPAEFIKINFKQAVGGSRDG